MTKTTTPSVIEVKLSTGKALPMRTATSKAGKTYWAILHPSTRRPARSVTVATSVVGDLPETAEVNGTTVNLKQAMSQSGNPQRKCNSVPVGEFPVDGEMTPFELSLHVTKLGSDRFVVGGSIHRTRGSGGLPTYETL